MDNVTLQDILGALLAVLGFGALLLSPGYVVGAATDLFGFRRRGPLERCAWAIALSFAISPMVIVLLGRLIPLGAVAGVFALVAVAALVFAFRDRRESALPVMRHTILLGVFLVFGAALIIFELIDIEIGKRLFLSVTTMDQSFRVAFINAIAHTGIPPQNPLYRAGGAAALRYYYFWYAVCAVCMKLTHCTARQALIGSSVWAGIGLIALIALFARHFLNVRVRLHRFILMASLLLVVTGLDIVPVLYQLLVHHSFSGDLEWWSIDQISSWFDSIVWVPNHMASLLCCLVAFLLLWRTREGLSRRDSTIATVLAGVAAASAFGLSIYVSAGCAMVMVGWTAGVVFYERNLPLARRIVVAVAVASVLLIPYLRELTHAASGTQERASAGAAHLFEISVRAMFDPDIITGLPILAALNRAHPNVVEQGARLVLLLPGYAVELGVFGLVLVLAIVRRKRLNHAHRTALALALGGLVIVSFLRSSVIGNNDFGYRAALLPCFFLLLLTAEKLTSGISRVERMALTLLIVVGVAGTAFQALMLRAFIPLHVAAQQAAFVGVPEAAFATRAADAAAARVIPATAIVQYNLVDTEYLAVAKLLYAERAMVTDAEEDCGAVFGGDPATCSQTQDSVRALFNATSSSTDEALKVCGALGIDYLSVAESDPAWQDNRGWVWRLPLVAGGGTAVRVVDCRGPKYVRK